MRVTDIGIERAGAALVVRRAGTDDDAARLAHATYSESRRVGVVVGPSAAAGVLDPTVAARLAAAVREHPSGAVRLLVSHTGGTPDALGPRLAAGLGVEVTAPDGDLLVLDDGHLFVAGRDAAWVTHTAAGTARRGGARSPAPWWQSALPAAHVPGLAVTPVPVGWWVRSADLPPAPLTDPVFAVVPDGQRPVLVVGAPGEPLPEVPLLADALRAMPQSLRETAVLAVYGRDTPRSPLAQRLADELGGPVSGLHGMPGHDGGRTMLLDADGEPTWEPFAQQSRYSPGAPPVVERWAPPVPGLLADGHAGYLLTDGWQLDVLPAGLLVRPSGVRPDPTWTRPGSDPTRVDLAVTGTAPPLDAISALVRDLPPETAALLRVRPVGHTTVDLDTLRSAAGLPSARPRIDLTRPAPPDSPDVPTVPAPGAAIGRPTDPTPPTADPDADADTDTDTDTDTEADADKSPDQRQGSDPLEPLTAPPTPTTTPPSPEPPAATATGTSAAPETTMAVTTTAAAIGTEVTAAVTEPAEPAGSGMDLARVAAPTIDLAVVTTAPRHTLVPAMPAMSTGPAVGGTTTARPSATVHRRPAQVLIDIDGRIWPAHTPIPLPDNDSPSPTTPAMSAAPTTPTAPAMSAAPVSPAVPVTSGSPAAPTVPVTPAAEQAVLADPDGVVATDEQRRAFRAAVGWRYDSATRVVARVLAERPGLRSRGDAAALTELAAVRLFAHDPMAGYDTAFAACLASGLRRLPTLRGVVVRGGPADTDLTTGSVLRLRTPVLAVADVDAAAPGAVSYLIWALTARRLDGLVDESRIAEVVLPAGSRFQVLAADPPASTPQHVLLAELPPGIDHAPIAGRSRLDAVADARRALAAAAAKHPAETTPPPAYLAAQPSFTAA